MRTGSNFDGGFLCATAEVSKQSVRPEKQGVQQGRGTREGRQGGAIPRAGGVAIRQRSRLRAKARFTILAPRSARAPSAGFEGVAGCAATEAAATNLALPEHVSGGRLRARRNADTLIRKRDRRPRYAWQQRHAEVRTERVERAKVDLVAEDGHTREAAAVAGVGEVFDGLADVHIGVQRRDLLPLSAV